MIKRLKRSFFKEKHQIETVAIKDCLHYCGFKYGGQQYNPYETFINRLHKEPDNILEIKKQFVNFLKYYRPQYINQAYSLILSKNYPLWFFPWQKHGHINYATNWVNDPDDIVDIITHFSEQGIPSYKIDQEFYWLARALQTIKTFGYTPDNHLYIEVLKFIDRHNNHAFLVLDGNHRISALHALNETAVKVIIKQTVSESDVKNWPQVKNGMYTLNDALAVFRFFFDGNVCYTTTNTPAVVLDYTNNYSILNAN